jgi:hypothetical protein
MNYDVPEGKLYDLTMIREIAHGNNDFVKKMMGLFNDTIPPAVTELKQHLADRNWSAMGAVAHKIKPSIDTMGITILKEDIRAVEKSGKELNDLENVPALMNKIELVINKIISDIKVEMETM